MAKSVSFNSVVDAVRTSLPDEFKKVLTPENGTKIAALVAGILLGLAGLYLMLSGNGHLPQLMNYSIAICAGAVLLAVGTTLTIMKSLLINEENLKYRINLHGEFTNHCDLALSNNNAHTVKYPMPSGSGAVVWTRKETSATTATASQDPNDTVSVKYLPGC